MANHWSKEDIAGMRAALAEAERAADEGEVPVGAAVALGGEIIARGRNCSVAMHDPTGHAEIRALREAANLIGNHRLTGATLYVTLEPCVMCTGAVVQARAGRVVFGAYDKKAGALGSVEDLSASRAFNHRFEVNGGVMADEASRLLQDFFRSRR